VQAQSYRNDDRERLVARLGIAATAAVRAALALTGRLFATADGGRLADRTFHHVTATLP